MRWRWRRSACPSGSQAPHQHLRQSHSILRVRRGRLLKSNATRNDAYLCKPSKLIIDGPNGLLNRLLERAADAHNLTDALHAAAEQPRHATELFEVPARDFDDDVVEARLEARRRHLRDRIFDLVERDAKAELCRDEGEWVARRLGRECRRPRQTRIDLYVTVTDASVLNKKQSRCC